ncbi:MAG: hypothetical protein ABIX01_20470 [Chitinophagaceae bacterium]
MNDNNYTVETSTSFLKYEFYSEGPKGKIKKQVLFKAFSDNANVYNLGFGDVGMDGEINDTIITNNKDSKKVLTTVATTVLTFFKQYPTAYVFATGSTLSRTRLYRISITSNLDHLQRDFIVYGFLNDNWNLFQKGVDYAAFLITQKKP